MLPTGRRLQQFWGGTTLSHPIASCHIGLLHHPHGKAKSLLQELERKVLQTCSHPASARGKRGLGFLAVRIPVTNTIHPAESWDPGCHPLPADGDGCSVTALLEHNFHSELSPRGDLSKEQLRTEIVKSILGKYSTEKQAPENSPGCKLQDKCRSRSGRARWVVIGEESQNSAPLKCSSEPAPAAGTCQGRTDGVTAPTATPS